MAKATSSNISIRMDTNLNVVAEALNEELGMNLSVAFKIFVRQSGIPFTITTEILKQLLFQQCWKQNKLLMNLMLRGMMTLMNYYLS